MTILHPQNEGRTPAELFKLAQDAMLKAIDRHFRNDGATGPTIRASIPAQWDDTDVIVMDALRVAVRQDAELTALRDERDKLVTELNEAGEYRDNAGIAEGKWLEEKRANEALRDEAAALRGLIASLSCKAHVHIDCITQHNNNPDDIWLAPKYWCEVCKAKARALLATRGGEGDNRG